MDFEKFLEGEAFLKSYKDLIDVAATPIDTVKEKITSQFEALPESLQNDMTEKQFLEMIAKTIDGLIKESESSKPKLNKSEHAHKLNHKFNWPLPIEITEGDLEKLMLIKGVAMTSGEMKRGEIMTDKNVTFATGAMSAGAMMNVVMIDIDHHESKLPSKYETNYGKEINEMGYPPAFIIDAGAEMNLIQPENEERMQTEFIAACTNRHVYEMIKEGKFKGCSVIDYYRKENCDCGHDQKHDGPCNSCTIEGSHFMTNTLILDEVPNSNATWVDIVTEDDIGTIIEMPNKSKLKQMKNSAKSLSMPNQGKLKLLQHNLKNHAEGDVDKYMDDGKWISGSSSIVSFLTNEKSIPEAKAEAMAEFIMDNPDLLSTYQLDWMSAEDFVAWFDHISQKTINARLDQLQSQIVRVSMLDHNATKLDLLKNFVPWGQNEVNYGDKDSNKCNGCRYFFAYDMEDLENTMGGCAIVVGDVFGQQGCDKFEANPNAGEDGPTDEEPVIEEPLDEENADEEIPTPDEEGNCPDGWHANEDGTECIKDEEEEEETDDEETGSEEKLTVGQKRLNMILGTKSHSAKPTVVVEEFAKTKSQNNSRELGSRINKVKGQLKTLGKSIIGKNQMENQTKYESLKKELKRLENLKKK